METSQYPYTPLNAEKREIRVLKACKAFGARSDAPDDLLAFNMTIISLEQPTHPRFNTLSYVWGDPVFDHYVKIDGIRVGVTANLHLALVQIFATGTNAYWWTDAICIDQSSMKERGSQVGFMDAIYRRSVNTIGHFGSFKPTKAFELITKMETRRQQPDPTVGLLEMFHDPALLSAWQCLEALSRERYWNRAWILQELVVSTKMRFLDAEGPWMDADVMYRILLAIEFLSTLNISLDKDDKPALGWHVQKKVSLGHNFRRIRSQLGLRHSYWLREGESSRPLEMMRLLLHSLQLEASDPRDHLYSIVSMIREGSNIIGTPRYDDSVHVIFASFVQQFHRKYLMLDVILLNSIARRIPDLPTWIPDLTSFEGKYWRNTMLKENLRDLEPGTIRTTLRYHASGTLQGDTSFSSDLRTMTTTGICLGTASGLGAWTAISIVAPGEASGPGIHHALDQVELNSDVDISSAELWESLANCLVLGWFGLARELPPRAFSLLLRQALSRSADDARLYFLPQTLQWWGQNQGLLVGRKSLGSWFLDGHDRQKEALDLQTLLQEDKNKSSTPGPVKVDQIMDKMLNRMAHVTIEMERRLLVTTEGRIGMVPSACELGDEVWILHGCTLPFVLRQLKDGGDLSYTLVGECYLHGVMQGEALAMGYPEQRVTLH